MSRRILVVDDESDVCIALRSVIEENGFEVDTFVDSFKALENFRSSLYDLLILDIKMPKMNGFKLYRRMKKIDHNIKVFFLTALADLHKYDAFKKEVYPKEREIYLIQKPIANEELLERINEVLIS
jgi:DNA-binding response OmpR family regulator